MAVATAPPRADQYRDDINGIRAIAVLLVVAYHAIPSLVPGGFIGVDIFFVISGYLITGNIVRDIDAGRFTFLDFYARRCRRIIPALAIVLGAVWVLGWCALLAGEFRNLGRHIVAGATFTTNFVLWKEAGFFDAAAESKPLLHLWSLGIEEQFYLLWPPFLLLVSGRRFSRLSAILAVLLGSFLLNVAFVRGHAITTFYMLPTRLWELAIGAVLAQLERRPNSGPMAAAMGEPAYESWARIPPGTTAWAAIGLVIGAAFVLTNHSVFPGWWAVVPTVATLALIAVGRSARVSQTLLSSRPLVLVGLISYPLYLWHWPLLSLGRIVSQGEAPIVLRTTLVAIAFVLSYLTWRIVEHPIQHRVFAFQGSRRLMRVCVGTTVCALVVAGGVGTATWADDGFPFRTRSEPLVDITRLQRLEGVYPRCSGALSPGDSLSWCLTASAGDPDIAVFGDSHAYYLFTGLAEVYQKRRQNVVVIGETACAPLSEVRSFRLGTAEQCLSANRLAVDLLARSKRIRTVVLASLGPYYFSGISVAVDHQGPADASGWMLESAEPSFRGDKPEIFQEGLSLTISQLERAGKDVVFFIDVPELDFRPESCVDSRPMRFGPSFVRTPCGISQSQVMRRQREYRAIVARLASAHPKMRVFDPVPYLCDGTFCEVKVEDRLLYRDSNHLSAFGSSFIAEKFAETMRVAGSTGP